MSTAQAEGGERASSGTCRHPPVSPPSQAGDGSAPPRRAIGRDSPRAPPPRRGPPGPGPRPLPLPACRWVPSGGHSPFPFLRRQEEACGPITPPLPSRPGTALVSAAPPAPAGSLRACATGPGEEVLTEEKGEGSGGAPPLADVTARAPRAGKGGSAERPLAAPRRRGPPDRTAAATGPGRCGGRRGAANATRAAVTERARNGVRAVIKRGRVLC